MQNSDIGWTKDGIFDSGHPQTPSNVTRFCRAVNVEDKSCHPQIVFYQNGLGSQGSLSDHLLGGGLAIGLSENIRAAYGFLANNYLEGDSPETHDKIFLLGYSRGAFTARSIAGLIGGFGLLKKKSMCFFYQIFEDWEGAGSKTYRPAISKLLPDFKIDVPAVNAKDYVAAYRAELRRLGLTREVDITAVGVWDTVGSLGLPVQPWLQKIGFPTTVHSYRFFDTGIDDHILNAFQALALDEHRAAFSPTIWERKNQRTNLKQVWFPGVHSNIGGGADDTGVSDITLAWMMSQMSAFIDFNADYLKEQILENKKSFESQKQKWTWGLGTLRNSLTFPTSLGGSLVRTPHLYHVTDYASGRPDPALLQNTNEHIHASVRARAILGGKTHDGKPYSSDALADWKLVDKDGPGGSPARWVYKGKDQAGKGKVMVEDELGVFERIGLEEDHEAVAKLFGT